MEVSEKMSSVIRIQSMKHNAPFQLEYFLQGLARIVQVDWIQQTTVNFFALRNGIGRIFFRLLGCEWSINDTLHPPFLEGELDSFTDVRMDLLNAAGFLIFQLIAQSHGLISNNNKDVMQHMKKQMKASDFASQL